MILLETQKEEFSKLKDVRIFGTDEKGERINGDLLVLGLGGVGGKVVANLKGMLKPEINSEDNIHYLLIDSDIPAMEDTIKASRDGIGLNALEVLSIYRPNLEDILDKGYNNQPVQNTLAKWMNPDFPHLRIGTEGAQGNRQVGRLMFSNAYEDMRILLFEKLEDLYSDSVSKKLDVIIVTSTCGGTGSGILADVTYNIKAYAKSRKWHNFRVGGCLIMPDALFAEKEIYEDDELRTLLLANGYATMKEVSEYIQAAYEGKNYVFESTSHRLSMCENIFDSCMLVSGKKDSQGYVPSGVIFSDVAYFLYKLAHNKYIDDADEDGRRKLLRDSFFEKNSLGYFKVVNEADYKIPIKEIENIVEYSAFAKAFSLMHKMPPKDEKMQADINAAFGEMRTFLEGASGDEITLSVNGLIKTGQFTSPIYKDIKKRTDRLSTAVPQAIEAVKIDIPVIVKTLRIRMSQSLDSSIEKYMKTYGPFITMRIIGSQGIGGCDKDQGMVEEAKTLEALLNKFTPSNEYEMTIESILQIVKKRFFTFPSAKRETENGYHEAYIKSALAQERNLLMAELNNQDVFGDIIRQLRQRAELLSDTFSQFSTDLENAVEDLALMGRKVVDFTLTDARRHEFLPSDYVTDERIEQFRMGLINMMVSHEVDINGDKVVPVSAEMEHVYKNFLLGLGIYPNEKVIAVAFADRHPSVQDMNAMFVSFDSEVRRGVMKTAAHAFVTSAMEKTAKKRLCILKDGFQSRVSSQKYISLPDSMPHFSSAMKEILTSEPYNESPDSITTNIGEQIITTDNFYSGVRIDMLECATEMETAYGQVVARGTYYGLHTQG
ncbi:MAG: tubulin-like doman-containing protein [Eubacterium sp.]|nr:tubulin-like doman-containing protein [Eubacterium sp.]